MSWVGPRSSWVAVHEASWHVLVQKSPPGKKMDVPSFKMDKLDFRKKKLPVFDEPVYGMSPPDVFYGLEVYGADIMDADSIMALMSSSLGAQCGAAAEEMVRASLQLPLSALLLTFSWCMTFKAMVGLTALEGL